MNYKVTRRCRPKCPVSKLLVKFFGLLVFWMLSHPGFGQAAVEQVKPKEPVHLILKNANSYQAVQQLADQVKEYTFTYSRQQLEGLKMADMQLKDMPLYEMLNRLESATPLQFSVFERTISVKVRAAIPARAHQPAPQEMQQQELSGTVRDTSGVLPGVSVQIKGTTIGTLTASDGSYRIALPNDQAIVVFSMVGYQQQEMVAGKQRSLDVLLQGESGKLDEVVVVAFGQQKRTDMVGSVVSINPSELKVPSSNLTTALAGRAAGIIAYQRSGEPGQDNADFFVRGVTTFGYKTSPLILIDGMELTTTDLARLQPDDILSFSIMKDATSTALYGARGANGVILVTTKQGAVGKAKLSFRLENSWSQPTANVSLADPVTYMQMANEAVRTRDPLGQIRYSEEKIENTALGTNSLVYPANDWRSLLFKDMTMNQRANLGVSGGGGVARYYVSGSFNQDNGVLRVDERNNFNGNIDLKSYTLRSNVTIDLTKSTEMIVRLSGNFDDYTGPINGGSDMYDRVMRANPVLFPAYFPTDEQHEFVSHIMYGNYGEGTFINPYADLTRGYKNYSRSLMLAQLELKQDLSSLVEGLSVRTMMNTNRSSYFAVSRFYNPFYYTLGGYDQLTGNYYITGINPDTGTEYLDYREDDRDVVSTFYWETMLNYNHTFGEKHNLSGLLVNILRQRQTAHAGDLQQSLPFRNSGVSGRATYAYDNRYFAEFNFGYNGSERFSASKRFGFFPSAGLAWSVSNERFFEPLKDVVSNLRIRATYGQVGNDEIGSPVDRFFYLSNVNMNDAGKKATFGTGVGSPLYSLNGITISRYANDEITWETATKKNVALELGLFDKINIQAEYFDEMRNNILMPRADIPVTMGLADVVSANVGKASARGTDISLDYQQSFTNSLWLSARGNFTYASSQYEIYEEPEYREAYRSRVGHSLNQRFGYIAERLFVDDAEAANSPRQNFGEYGAGDIKYLDVNRDGQITEADQVPIGLPTLPEIVYGFGFSVGFKNVDLSAFFQGLANESFWIDAAATSPFDNETQVLEAYAQSHWTEDDRDVYALWPRLSPVISINNTQPSTWFMRNGSFLRLKQVELGYTFPASVQRKLGASNLRLYVNAMNLLTLSRFKLWDVEMGGDGLGYPIQRVFNLGVNVSFN